MRWILGITVSHLCVSRMYLPQTIWIFNALSDDAEIFDLEIWMFFCLFLFSLSFSLFARNTRLTTPVMHYTLRSICFFSSSQWCTKKSTNNLSNCIDCKIEQLAHKLLRSQLNADVKHFLFYDIRQPNIHASNENWLRLRMNLKLFILGKWVDCVFLLKRTIACKMVSTLSQCKQSLSFSQSLCKYLNCVWHYSAICFVYFEKSISVTVSKCMNRFFFFLSLFLLYFDLLLLLRANPYVTRHPAWTLVAVSFGVNGLFFFLSSSKIFTFVWTAFWFLLVIEVFKMFNWQNTNVNVYWMNETDKATTVFYCNCVASCLADVYCLCHCNLNCTQTMANLHEL